MQNTSLSTPEQAAAIANLVTYVECLLQGQPPKACYDRCQAGFAGLDSLSVFRGFWQLQQGGRTAEELLRVIPMVILATQSFFVPDEVACPDEPFLAEMRAENDAMMAVLDRVRPRLRETRSPERDAAIAAALAELKQFNAHFVRKQNILFPTLESKDEAFSALSLLWAWHDESRAALDQTLAAFADPQAEGAELNRLAGELFALYASLPTKEERFLFPAAARLLDPEDWAAMHQQAQAYPLAFGLREAAAGDPRSTTEAGPAGFFRTGTGTLSFEQLAMVLNHLPVDITVVDEHDNVLYFNDAPERIFPRSPAIVGRQVKNCHPPKSLAKVEEIILAFREGREDHARFWMNLHGRKLLIEYFCLRDAEGHYRGVLEASQDITEISELEGENRLSGWSAR